MSAATVRDVRLRRTWPPVEVVERTETKEEIVDVALALTFGQLPLYLLPGATLLKVILLCLAVLTWGYVLAYPFVYGLGGDE